MKHPRDACSDSPLLEEEVASAGPLSAPPPLRFELPQLAATHAAVISAAAMMIEPPMRMRLQGTSFGGAGDSGRVPGAAPVGPVRNWARAAGLGADDVLTGCLDHQAVMGA